MRLFSSLFVFNNVENFRQPSVNLAHPLGGNPGPQTPTVENEWPVGETTSELLLTDRSNAWSRRQ